MHRRVVLVALIRSCAPWYDEKIKTDRVHVNPVCFVCINPSQGNYFFVSCFALRPLTTSAVMSSALFA